MGSGGSGGGWWLWRLQHWYRCYMQHWQQQHESVTNADYRSAGNLGRGVADVGIGLHCSSLCLYPATEGAAAVGG